MGNLCAQPTSSPSSQTNWIPRNQPSAHHLFYNRLTRQQAVCQSYIIDQPSTNDSLIFSWRQTCPSLVGAHLIDAKDIDVEGKTVKERTIFVESIKYKVSQLVLNEDESYYCLLESLKGFSQIYQKIGYVSVNSEMIGVNKDGKIKVWMNQDFRLNFKNGDNYDKQTFLLNTGCSFERDMMNQIVKAINNSSGDCSINQNVILQNFRQTIDHITYLIKTKQIPCAKRVYLTEERRNKNQNVRSTYDFKSSVASTRVM